MLEILLGQVPEAIYFALFVIFTKQLKEKRVIFVLITVAEYVLLFNIRPFTSWIHVGFFVLTYILLKILYKEKSQIIDVFTLMIELTCTRKKLLETLRKDVMKALI